jgi:hypothetical protein
MDRYTFHITWMAITAGLVFLLGMEGCGVIQIQECEQTRRVAVASSDQSVRAVALHSVCNP